MDKEKTLWKLKGWKINEEQNRIGKIVGVAQKMHWQNTTEKFTFPYFLFFMHFSLCIYIQLAPCLAGKFKGGIASVYEDPGVEFFSFDMGKLIPYRVFE